MPDAEANWTDRNQKKHVAKSGRKEEFEHPVTDERKAAWRLRMKRTGISQSTLATKLGVTRQAISHLFKAAKQSSLVPAVDRILGFGPPPPAGVTEKEWSELDEEQRDEAIRTEMRWVHGNGATESFDGAIGKIRDPRRIAAWDSDGREMLYYMANLAEANRSKLVDFARVLYETQQKDIQRNGLLIMLDTKEREAKEHYDGAKEMHSFAADRVRQIDEALAAAAAEKDHNKEAGLARARGDSLTSMQRWSDQMAAAQRTLADVAEMRKQAVKLAKSKGKQPDDLDVIRRALKLSTSKD